MNIKEKISELIKGCISETIQHFENQRGNKYLDYGFDLEDDDLDQGISKEDKLVDIIYDDCDEIINKIINKYTK